MRVITKIRVPTDCCVPEKVKQEYRVRIAVGGRILSVIDTNNDPCFIVDIPVGVPDINEAKILVSRIGEPYSEEWQYVGYFVLGHGHFCVFQERQADNASAKRGRTSKGVSVSQK